jgi:N-acetylneuraminic acid mutarotase
MKKNYTFLTLLLLAGTVWLTNAYSQNGWEELAPIATPRTTTATCAIGHDIYVFGGWTTAVFPLAAAEKYNTETEETTTLENMRAGVSVSTADTLNGKVYVAGGWPNNDFAANLLQVYDPVSDSWDLKKELPVKIGHHVSGVINGKLYVAGGLHTGVDTDAFKESISYVYDPGTDEWDSIAPMNSTLKMDTRQSGIWQASSCVHNGKLYVFGGIRMPDNFIGTQLSRAEMYDPVTDVWTDLAPMLLPIAAHTSVAYNKKIYVFGGTTESNFNTLIFQPSNRVFEYDPDGNSWQEMEPMPVGLMVCSEGHVIDHYFYLVGGDDDRLLGGEEVTSVWRFDLDSIKPLGTDIKIYDKGSNLAFALLPNHPNPFSENTTFRYELKQGGAVELRVYDMLGRKISTLVDEVQVPGEYNSTWNAEGTMPGIYFCELRMDGYKQIIKMIKW